MLCSSRLFFLHQLATICGHEIKKGKGEKKGKNIYQKKREKGKNNYKMRNDKGVTHGEKVYELGN